MDGCNVHEEMMVPLSRLSLMQLMNIIWVLALTLSWTWRRDSLMDPLQVKPFRARWRALQSHLVVARHFFATFCQPRVWCHLLQRNLLTDPPLQEDPVVISLIVVFCLGLRLSFSSFGGARGSPRNAVDKSSKNWMMRCREWPHKWSSACKEWLKLSTTRPFKRRRGTWSKSENKQAWLLPGAWQLPSQH